VTYYISVEPTRVADEAFAPLIVREGRHGRHQYTRLIKIEGPSVLVCGRNDPLPDGTRVWVQTEGPITYREET
jgi:hypothetical protein